jgi:hypothetical protein
MPHRRNRSTSWAASAATLALVGAAPAFAGGPAIDPSPAGIRTDDTGTRVDANQISMVVTNLGSFGFDIPQSNSGLEFPRGSGRTALFAGGLWLGASVAGQVRVTVGEYAMEYVPGPMAGGTFLPDGPDFKVYKVSAADTTGWAEWMAKAVPQGAPTSSDGTRPGILGAQTLWTVYNDANPDAHTNDAGNSLPLGIEVQQTVWAYDEPGSPRDQAVFLRFRLINKGAQTLQQMYVGWWADPDLGGFADDLVGCDTTLGMGYCYNATNNDAIYGANPPALGYVLVQGPHDAGGGPIGIASFSKYISGTDPSAPLQSYNYMRGRMPDGSPVIDPTTNQATPFWLSGDPVMGTGWLDSNPADRRFLLASGPFRMDPSDTQDVVLAIVIGQASNRLSSITALRYFADPAFTDVPPAGTGPSVQLAVGPNPAAGPLTVTFSPRPGEPWRLDAFDVRGRSVAVLDRGVGGDGAEKRTWDPTRGRGGPALAPGLYWLRLVSGSARVVRRVVVLPR